MDLLELTLRLSAGVFLVLANAFFVATEFALTRLPQLDEADFQDSAALRRAWSMLDRLEIYLTGCQLGITTSSILLGIVAEPAVTALLEPIVSAIGLTGGTASVVSVVAAVILINLIHKIWGEQAPTYIGVERPKTIARLTAPLHYGWTTLTYPFILLGDGLAKWTLALFGVEIQRSWTEAEPEETPEPSGNRTELTRKMADLLRERNVPADRREEVLNALEIGTLPVRDVMVPRDDIVAFSTERSLQANRDVLAEHPLHSRYPLTGASLDDVKGFVYVPVVLREWDALRDGASDLADVATPALSVSPDCPVSDVIDRLQSEDHEIVMIAEDGRTVGLVTITDAFEAIVGDMQDPFDEGEASTEPQPHAVPV
jgi:CBS domain containing-hemolysin-like protein